MRAPKQKSAPAGRSGRGATHTFRDERATDKGSTEDLGVKRYAIHGDPSPVDLDHDQTAQPCPLCDGVGRKCCGYSGRVQREPDEPRTRDLVELLSGAAPAGGAE